MTFPAPLVDAIRWLSSPFPALRQRNFRYFWFGQIVSLVGTWMQNIGLAWLVIKLTNSPFLLGLVSAMQFLPVMLFSLFAGPFVDRFPKRKMLLFTQSALMVLALVMVIITGLGIVQYWMIIVLSVLLGFINTLDIPTRQSFVIELAGREHLVNAISLNSAAFNTARMVGPAVAGILIGLVGIAPCFLLNALSFVAVLWALMCISLPHRVRQPVEGHRLFQGVLASVGEGLAYVRARPALLLPLLQIGLLSTIVINYSVFVPVFARRQLKGDAIHFGLLMTSMGIGSLVAALRLAVRSRRGPQLRSLTLGAVGMSAFFLLTGFQTDFLLSGVCLGLTGFFTITFTASANAWVQLQSGDSMRGRVMSIYALVFGGVTPIGSLYAGWIIDAVGISPAIIVSGVLGLLSTLGIVVVALFWSRHRVEHPLRGQEPDDHQDDADQVAAQNVDGGDTGLTPAEKLERFHAEGTERREPSEEPGLK